MKLKKLTLSFSRSLSVDELFNKFNVVDKLLIFSREIKAGQEFHEFLLRCFQKFACGADAHAVV